MRGLDCGHWFAGGAINQKPFTMTKKKTFALRVDNDMMSAVERWAADEFRSTNGQLEWIIYKALKDARRIKKGTSVPASGEE